MLDYTTHINWDDVLKLTTDKIQQGMLPITAIESVVVNYYEPITRTAVIRVARSRGINLFDKSLSLR